MGKLYTYGVFSRWMGGLAGLPVVEEDRTIWLVSKRGVQWYRQAFEKHFQVPLLRNLEMDEYMYPSTSDSDLGIERPITVLYSGTAMPISKRKRTPSFRVLVTRVDRTLRRYNKLAFYVISAPYTEYEPPLVEPVVTIFRSRYIGKR